MAGERRNEERRSDASSEPTAPASPSVAPGKCTLKSATHEPANGMGQSFLPGAGSASGASSARDVWSPSSVFDALGLDDETQGEDGTNTGSTAHRSSGFAGAKASAVATNGPNRQPARRETSRDGGSEEMWAQVIGEKSTSVGKPGRVDHLEGASLRRKPLPSDAPLAVVPFNSMVQLQRITEHGWAWVVVLDGSASGKSGFIAADRVAADLPEPTARLHWVTSGERLGEIARRYYGDALGKEDNERLFVQALYEANRGRAGIHLDKVELPTMDTWHRTESAEESLRTFKGAKVKKDHALWIPSLSFVQALKRSGEISAGRPIGAGAWDEAKEVVGGALESATYGAGVLVGVLEGAWKAVVDLFKGAVEMIETVGKTVFYALSGDLGAIKKMATDLIDKLKAAWANRGEIADAFLAKWNDPDAWTRGNFQGEVLGWVMMTVLLVILTMGEGVIATALGSSAWGARFLAAVRTADALGDVTTYARGLSRMLRLPGAMPNAVGPELRRNEEAADHPKPKIEKGSPSGRHEGSVASSSSHTPGEHSPETVTVHGLAQSPRLQWAKNTNGAVRTIEEALEMARRNGVEIPDDIIIRKTAGKLLPKNSLAAYFGRIGIDPNKTISWAEFFDEDLDGLLVRVDQTVFESDEAIVAILAHEMHELNNLRIIFEESGGFMSHGRLFRLINPGQKGNLHDEAWDIADAAVINMRKNQNSGPLK